MRKSREAASRIPYSKLLIEESAPPLLSAEVSSEGRPVKVGPLSIKEKPLASFPHPGKQLGEDLFHVR